LAPAAVSTTSNSVCSSRPPPELHRRRAASGRSRHDRGHAELVLERLDELRQLEDGHVADGVEQLFLVSHCRFFL
jgi:hypothetical protein